MSRAATAKSIAIGALAGLIVFSGLQWLRPEDEARRTRPIAKTESAPQSKQTRAGAAPKSDFSPPLANQNDVQRVSIPELCNLYKSSPQSFQMWATGRTLRVTGRFLGPVPVGREVVVMGWYGNCNAGFAFHPRHSAKLQAMDFPVTPSVDGVLRNIQQGPNITFLFDGVPPQ